MKHPGMRRAVAAFAIGMTLTWSTSTYGAEKADTTRTMLQLSAKAADQKARQDLLSILQPTGVFTKGNRIRVSGIAMDTVPYGAGFRGLCRKDELFLVYSSTVKGRNSVDDPLRPVGLEMERRFRVSKGPVRDSHETTSQEAGWDDADCRAPKAGKSDLWFSAPDARRAARAVNVLLAATAEIRAGRVSVSDCGGSLKGTTCGNWMLELGRLEKMIEVNDDCAAGPGQACYRMNFIGPIEVLIVASFDGDESVQPTAIASVSAYEYTVVS